MLQYASVCSFVHRDTELIVNVNELMLMILSPMNHGTFRVHKIIQSMKENAICTQQL